RGGDAVPAGRGPAHPARDRPGSAGGVRSAARARVVPGGVPGGAAGRAAAPEGRARPRARGGGGPGPWGWGGHGGGPAVRLGGSRLPRRELVDGARGDGGVELPAEARQRVRASRRVVDDAVRAGRVVYGVTTGFGRLKDQSIAPEDTRALQLNLLRSHSAG